MNVLGRFVITLVTVVVVALTVPVSQLRWVEIDRACCCPDPESCQCPDHDGNSSESPAMRACHNTQQAITNPPAPAFEPATFVVVGNIDRAAEYVIHRRPRPHAPPEPRRPDAPS